MKKTRKKLKCIFSVFILSITVFSNFFIADAKQMSTYTTYTYDSEGNAVDSPAAYEFSKEYTGEDFGIDDLKNPSDIFIDSFKNIYITDSGNNRIVILNSDFSLKKILLDFEPLQNNNSEMAIGTFSSPSSVFVDNKNNIFVADTDNNRIVEFDENYNCIRIIEKPKTDILDDDYVFSPISIVVDSSDRIYILVKNDNDGIMELTSDGNFTGYYGAQKVNSTIFDWIKTLFMTKAQKSRIVKTIPRSYNSMAIDDKDFIWMTSNSLTVYQRMNYMKSKSSADASIKRLNPSGNDVLSREGEYAPGGDLIKVSSIVDVAVKSNGAYSLLDDGYNRIFTYDSRGNLLYAFGGKGTQDGCLTLASSLAYFDDDLLVLDSSDNSITRYKMTEYAQNIQSALLADDNKDFESSLKYWKKVLNKNENLQLAYKAIGNSYLRLGKYSDAMKFYKNADQKDGYSKAYSYIRADYVKKNFILVITVILAVVVLCVFFKRWVNKENSKMLLSGNKSSLKSQLLYAWRTIYHPFDCFWEIKKHNKGSFASASIILIAIVLSFCYKEVGTGYLFREESVENINLLIIILTVLIPLVLWCFASWGLTTLFEGKGKMKDIYIMTCYSFFPVIFTNVLTTIMSNGMTLAEGNFITFISAIGYIWAACLLIAGSMTIHEYSFGKNTVMIVTSIVGMGIIMFLAMLFITVGQKLIDFITAVYEEVVYRL